MTNNVLQNATVRLLKSRPFYGYLLLNFRRRETVGEKPLGVTLENGTPVLAVSPESFLAYAPREQEALLEHVLLHVLHLHPLRGKGRHGRDWDLACDFAVNPLIEGLPVAAPRPEKLKLPPGLTAEEYYRQIGSPFDTGNLSGQGFGNADRDAGEHRQQEAASDLPLDDHGIWAEAESTPARLAEEVVRGMVREAHQRSSGEVPGELRRLVDDWLRPGFIPWPQILRQFVATAGRVGRRSTWKREHRRFGHDTPGYRKEQRLHLLVGVDASDSTNQRPLREAFARELLQIARGRDSRLTVLYAGSRIQRIETFSGSPAVVEAYEGGGFTDLRPVFEYARTLHPRPAAVIYLTDGFGPAPETMEFPTLWVLTREGKRPVEWGVELRLDA